jgi:hypothetical protein
MNRWQAKARNKALNEKKKAARQGAAIVEAMRERRREKEIQEQGSLEELCKPAPEGTGLDLSINGNEADPQDSPSPPPEA